MEIDEPKRPLRARRAKGSKAVNHELEDLRGKLVAASEADDRRMAENYRQQQDSNPFVATSTSDPTNINIRQRNMEVDEPEQMEHSDASDGEIEIICGEPAAVFEAEISRMKQQYHQRPSLLSHSIPNQFQLPVTPRIYAPVKKPFNSIENFYHHACRAIKTRSYHSASTMIPQEFHPYTPYSCSLLDCLKVLAAAASPNTLTEVHDTLRNVHRDRRAEDPNLFQSQGLISTRTAGNVPHQNVCEEHILEGARGLMLADVRKAKSMMKGRQQGMRERYKMAKKSGSTRAQRAKQQKRVFREEQAKLEKSRTSLPGINSSNGNERPERPTTPSPASEIDRSMDTMADHEPSSCWTQGRKAKDDNEGSARGSVFTSTFLTLEVEMDRKEKKKQKREKKRIKRMKKSNGSLKATDPGNATAGGQLTATSLAPSEKQVPTYSSATMDFTAMADQEPTKSTGKGKTSNLNQDNALANLLKSSFLTKNKDNEPGTEDRLRDACRQARNDRRATKILKRRGKDRKKRQGVLMPSERTQTGSLKFSHQ